MLAAITVSLDSHWVEMYKVLQSETSSAQLIPNVPGTSHHPREHLAVPWAQLGDKNRSDPVMFFASCTDKRMRRASLILEYGALVESWKARLVWGCRHGLTNLLNLQVLWPSKTAQTLLFGISMHFVKWWWRARTMSSPFFWVIEHVFTVYEHLYLPIFTVLGQTWHFKTAFGQQHVQNMFIDMFSIDTTVHNMDN